MLQINHGFLVYDPQDALSGMELKVDPSSATIRSDMPLLGFSTLIALTWQSSQSKNSIKVIRGDMSLFNIDI